MNETTEKGEQPRGGLARIGLSLLSFLVPGLGLIRSGNPKLGILFALLYMGFLFAWLGYFSFSPMLTFASWAVISSLVIIAFLIGQLGSSIVTFLKSKKISRERPWWNRWYVIVAIIPTWFGIQEIATSNLQNEYRNFYVPAKSMNPTLLIDDRFVAKMSDWGQPQRGDILIVRNENTEYVKRLVGLPGDTLEMRLGQVSINGVAAQYEEKSGLGNDDMCDALTQTSPIIVLETLPGTKNPHLIADCRLSYMDDVSPIKLGDDQYYFLGDNRDLSADSRVLDSMGLGIVTRDQLVGKPLFFYWSDDRERIGQRVNPE